jgi:hypothetical protein
MPSTLIRLGAAALCVLALAPAAAASEPALVSRGSLLNVSLRPATEPRAGSGGDGLELVLPPDTGDPATPAPRAKTRAGLVAGTAALYAAGVAGFVTGGLFLAARNQTRTDFLARPSFTKAELDATTARATTQNTVGILSLVGGALLAGGGVACTFLLVF